MHARENALNKWLEKVYLSPSFSLTPLLGDASFRRYYRLYHNGTTQIVMDVPPEKDTLTSFVKITKLLANANIRIPIIRCFDEQQGFAILEDFGDTLLLHKLNTQTAGELYRSAMSTLLTMQQGIAKEVGAFELFDQQFILQELELFNQWFVTNYLNILLNAEESALLQKCFAWLSYEISQLPQAFIHRDFHSRNIMLIDQIELGIIDFQDAMLGPFTYDLVSLLKDSYIQWPSELISQWLTQFYLEAELGKQCTFSDFMRAFELCGIQRHLKNLGVFSRLCLRDDKPGYLVHLPLTLRYIMDCLVHYDELQDLHGFLSRRVGFLCK